MLGKGAVTGIHPPRAGTRIPARPAPARGGRRVPAGPIEDRPGSGRPADLRARATRRAGLRLRLRARHPGAACGGFGRFHQGGCQPASAGKRAASRTGSRSTPPTIWLSTARLASSAQCRSSRATINGISAAFRASNLPSRFTTRRCRARGSTWSWGKPRRGTARISPKIVTSSVKSSPVAPTPSHGRGPRTIGGSRPDHREQVRAPAGRAGGLPPAHRGQGRERMGKPRPASVRRRRRVPCGIRGAAATFRTPASPTTLTTCPRPWRHRRQAS